MRVTIDLMKKSTQIIDLSNVINPRVGDDDLLLPLHICYGDNLYDMRENDVEFLTQDTNKNNIYIAGTCNTNTPGDNLYTGDLTFRFPAGTFKVDGTYDPDQTMFRIVDKATQKVISSVNVKITVMKNAIEFNFDPNQSSYDSRAETMLQDFHDKGQAMLDEINSLNNQAKSNVSGDTAATANAAKQQADQNAGDISGLKGEIAGARGRFADLPGREDAQDTAISQKETIVNANDNYAALQQKDAQQDAAITQKAEKFELEDKLSQMDLHPEGFENEAALKADYPNGKPGIMVTADTGHKWIWINGTWQDCGVYQSAGIADNSIPIEKLTDELQSAFLPNVEEISLTLNTGYLDVKTGNINSDARGRYSNDVTVEPGDSYIVKGKSFWNGALVVFKQGEEIKDYYPKSLDNINHTLKVTVPSDANTMLINVDATSTPRVFKVNDYSTLTDAVQNLSALLEYQNYVWEEVAVEQMPESGFWDYKDGLFKAQDAASDKASIAYRPIKVKPLEVYRITGSSAWDARLCTFIDAQGNVLNSMPSSSNPVQSIDVLAVVPVQAAYMEINNMVPGGSTKIEKATSIMNILANKKWCAIGDSWTTIHSDTGQGYVNNVTGELGIVADNAGGSGTGYMTSYKTEPFYQRKVSSDADVYTILGSFNDAYNSKFKFGQSGDTGTDTFWGAIKATVDNIYGTNFDAQIGIISPGPWGAINPHIDNNAKMSSLATFEDSTIGDMSIVDFAEKYVQTLHDFAKENSLPFLDLYHYSNLRPWDSNFITKYYHGTSDTDNTHPNAIAFAKFISPKVSNFIKKII